MVYSSGVDINRKEKDIPSGQHVHNYERSPILMGKSMISMAIFNSYAILPERLDHGSGCSPPRRPAPWEPRRERPPVVKGTLPSRARAPQSPPGSPQPDEGKDLDGPGHRKKGPVRTKLSKPTKMWIWQWKTHQKFIRNGNFTNKE